MLVIQFENHIPSTPLDLNSIRELHNHDPYLRT